MCKGCFLSFLEVLTSSVRGQKSSVAKVERSAINTTGIPDAGVISVGDWVWFPSKLQQHHRVLYQKDNTAIIVGERVLRKTFAVLNIQLLEKDVRKVFVGFVGNVGRFLKTCCFLTFVRCMHARTLLWELLLPWETLHKTCLLIICSYSASWNFYLISETVFTVRCRVGPSRKAGSNFPQRY